MTATSIAAAASAMAAAAVLTAGLAGGAPFNLPTGAFGTPQEVIDGEPQVVLAYTVQDLRRSGIQVLDVPLLGTVPLAGELWDATATIRAVRGSAVPALPSFFARSADGQSYRMLSQTLAPDLDASPLEEGKSSTLRIYFDVTGAAPIEVVYDDGRHVPLQWQ